MPNASNRITAARIHRFLEAYEGRLRADQYQAVEAAAEIIERVDEPRAYDGAAVAGIEATG